MRLTILLAGALLLAGCSLLTPPEGYVSGENFGNGGKTRCGNVNTPKQWLKPCE